MSIASELTRLNTNKEALATAKTAIASAITTKGGTVASGDGFADFATDIASIPSGGGTDYLQYATQPAKLFQEAVMPENLVFDFPNATTFDSLLYKSNGWKTLDITFTDKVTSFASLVRECDPYTTGWTHTVTLHGSTKNVTTFYQAFYQCKDCTLLGDPIDFSGVTNPNYMAAYVGEKNFRAVPNTIKVSSFSGSNFLNFNNVNHHDLVEMANALSDSAAGTITAFGSTSIAELSLILGTTTTVDGHSLFVESVGGTLTLADFISNTKGWTVTA